MSRTATRAVILALAAAFGFAVFAGLGHLRSGGARPATAANQTEALLTVPGTVYLASGGALFRMQGGRFTQLQPASGHWSQPAVTPDHRSLVAVSRDGQASDLVLLDAGGRLQSRLTANASRTVENNHWAFYPRLSPDGQSVFFSTDNPKAGFKVDLSIWAQPLAGGRGRRWTVPNDYTGGDVSPLPLANNGLLYAEFAIDAGGKVFSQVWLQRGPLRGGVALTDPGEDCGQPALSAAGNRLAMICTGGGQAGRVVVADFDGNRLGPRQVVLDGKLAAMPAWSPDGTSLLFMAPGGGSGRFQLWWLTPPPAPGAASPSPAAPAWRERLVTGNLDLDATSGLAWI